ncbi:MAG: helix-turn-helix transcriptional regulator [Gordonia sp. (in: high G+C Gram-positive bacteria)]
MISVAAELAGMHAQTLRTYDRLGLVSPQRTSGGGRRYSTRDVQRLREIQRLSQAEGVNLAGIKRIIELSNQVDELRRQVSDLSAQMERRARGGEMVPVPRPNALVVWRPRSQR